MPGQESGQDRSEAWTAKASAARKARPDEERCTDLSAENVRGQMQVNLSVDGRTNHLIQGIGNRDAIVIELGSGGFDPTRSIVVRGLVRVQRTCMPAAAAGVL